MPTSNTTSSSQRRWLVTGASGQLGGHVLCELRKAFPEDVIVAWARQASPTDLANVAWRTIDLSDLGSVERSLADASPTHVVHLGAITSVAEAFAQQERALRVNAEATAMLAKAAEKAGARLVFSSTDMVFDGDSPPYREGDATRPLSHYGRTKERAEQALSSFTQTVIARLPLLIGMPRFPKETTFASQIRTLREGKTLRLFTDEFRTPIWLRDAARPLIALALSDFHGVIHVGGPERLSRYEIGERIAAMLGIANPGLSGVSRQDIAVSEPRPADLSLDSTLFRERFPGVVLRNMSEGEPLDFLPPG